MKLFVFDVDGTLINDDEPTPELIAAVNERLQKGDAIAIASGRPYTGIKPYLNYFQDGKKSLQSMRCGDAAVLLSGSCRAADGCARTARTPVSDGFPISSGIS